MLGRRMNTAEEEENRGPSFLRFAVNYSSPNSSFTKPKQNMDMAAANQQKNERSRTRWTASYDRIFADLLVKQINQGNRPNNVFDKKTWSCIREEFNGLTGLKFNNNQLRKHLDVLRTRFCNLKSATGQNDCVPEDPNYMGFDLWEDIEAYPRSETVKVKDCPIFEQLCTIFSESSTDGQYAQSSHFEGPEKSLGNNAAEYHEGINLDSENTPSRSMQKQAVPAEIMVKRSMERKRKRHSENNSIEQKRLDEDACDAMAEALFEMIAASKSRNGAQTERNEKFSISNCIKALDEVGETDQHFYLAALDLFEDPGLRETFISLKGKELRLSWLQGKCGGVTVALPVGQDAVPVPSFRIFSNSEIHPSTLFGFPQFS